MKYKSYIKAALSAIVWGLGQVFNRQYLKALLFFAIFVLFVGIELGTSNYFYQEPYENEMAYSKIQGDDLGDSFFEKLRTDYSGYIRQIETSGLKVGSRTMTLEEVQNENFEKFLVDNNISSSNPLTEQLFIEFLAQDIDSISQESFTNLETGVELENVSVNTDNIVVFSESLLWDQTTNKFYITSTTTDEIGNDVTEYVQRNLLLNNGANAITDPEVLDTNEGLVAFSKIGNIYTYNNDFYLEVIVNNEEDSRFIEINENNELNFYTGDVSNLNYLEQPEGQLFIYGNTLVERYLPGQFVAGEYTQYKESTIMFTFRMAVDQAMRQFGQIGADDISKFQFKVYLELNPDVKDAFLNNQIHFFADRAGLFVKGYWQVFTLGRTTNETITAHRSLDDNVIGVDYVLLNSTSLDTPVFRGGTITILGHVSTMFLIEGLIAIILSLFFFIFMIWSVLDAFRAAEKLRKEEEVETTKEYFKSVWDNGFEYIVLSPAIFVLGFISIMPIVFGFILAFTSISGGASMNGNFDYVGLRNFFALFNFQSGLGATFGKAFWSVLLWTIIWAVFSTGTVFFGGFIQALILNSDKVVFRKLWRTVLILPWAIPALLSQMVFSVIFGETGFINELFRNIGLYSVFENIGILGQPYNAVSGLVKAFWLGEQNIMWFSNPFNTTFVRTTLIVVNIWLGFPYFMALMTGIMTAIDRTLYEAADIDGATGFQKITKITIPMVLYSTAPILIMSFSGNFNNFGVIYFITQGGPGGGASTGFAGNTDILISWMYKLTVDHSIYNMASVFSVLIFLLVGSVTAWNLSKTRAFQGD